MSTSRIGDQSDDSTVLKKLKGSYTKSAAMHCVLYECLKLDHLLTDLYLNPRRLLRQLQLYFLCVLLLTKTILILYVLQSALQLSLTAKLAWH